MERSRISGNPRGAQPRAIAPLERLSPLVRWGSHRPHPRSPRSAKVLGSRAAWKTALAGAQWVPQASILRTGSRPPPTPRPHTHRSAGDPSPPGAPQQQGQPQGLRCPQLHGPATVRLGPQALPLRRGWPFSSRHHCNWLLHLWRTDRAPGRGGEGSEPASLPSAPRDLTVGRAALPAGPSPLLPLCTSPGAESRGAKQGSQLPAPLPASQGDPAFA